MARYFDSLRPASFRGIAFLTPSDDTGFGRRIATHEYPGRDEPYHEDMGMAVQDFTVEAVIQGAAFVADAATFETALKRKGAGTLIHPHMGEIEVIVKSARRSHSSDAVGEVRFSITFEKYGKPLYPAAATDTAAVLGSAGESLFSALQSDFKTAFKIDSMPDFVADDALSRAESFVSDLQNVMSKGGVLRLASSLFPVALAVEAEGFADQVTGLFKSIAALAAPKKKPFLSSSSQAGKPATTAAADVKSLTVALSDASTISVADAVTPATTTQSVRVANAAALDTLFRFSSLAAAGQAARHIVYDSREEAIAMRDRLAAQIGAVRDQLGNAGWDQTWSAAGGLLAALTSDINERIGRLPRTVTILPATVRTSLDLSNRLYGDDPASLFSKAGDIVTRNAVRQPLFVPVKNLEVLISA